MREADWNQKQPWKRREDLALLHFWFKMPEDPRKEGKSQTHVCWSPLKIILVTSVGPECHGMTSSRG